MDIHRAVECVGITAGTDVVKKSSPLKGQDPRLTSYPAHSLVTKVTELHRRLNPLGNGL